MPGREMVFQKKEVLVSPRLGKKLETKEKAE